MNGHLEPLSAILRVGGAYGEPFIFAVGIRYLTPTHVEIIGLNNHTVKPSEFKAVMQILAAHGVEQAWYKRQDEAEHRILWDPRKFVTPSQEKIDD